MGLAQQRRKEAEARPAGLARRGSGPKAGTARWAWEATVGMRPAGPRIWAGADEVAHAGRDLVFERGSGPRSMAATATAGRGLRRASRRGGADPGRSGKAGSDPGEDGGARGDEARR